MLIAAAAEPELRRAEVAALDHAYFPWIGALHSLLDNVVDRREDVRTDQPSLVGYYDSPAEAAARLRLLAVQAVGRARALPDGRRHLIILAAMAGNYLSNPEADAPDVREVARSVLDAIGDLAAPTLLVFKLRRLPAASASWIRSRTASRPTQPRPPRPRTLELRDSGTLDTTSVPE